MAAERQRADTTLDTLRAEHHREVEALQAALTALRTAQSDQPAFPSAQKAASAPPEAAELSD